MRTKERHDRKVVGRAFPSPVGLKFVGMLQQNRRVHPPRLDEFFHAIGGQDEVVVVLVGFSSRLAGGPLVDRYGESSFARLES